MNEIEPVAPGLPDNYEPEESLKKMTVAEAAETYYLRAKDPDKLYDAIEAKLTEQRRFVLWWDGVKEHGGDRRSEFQGNRSVTLKNISGAPDKMTISRWRSRLSTPENFNASISKAKEKCLLACEAKGDPFARIHGNKFFEWYTPKKYIDAARKTLGSIDLDPASSEHAQKIVQAKRYFSLEEGQDAFEHEWTGNIWMNPPFDKPMPFVERLVEAAQAGSQCLLLTNNNTDTRWWQLAAGNSATICFTDHRIKFYNAAGDESAPTNGQTFFYFGGGVEEFARNFSVFGLIMACV